MPNSNIIFQDAGLGAGFEIVETVMNQGAGKVFGKTYTRKLNLKTSSYHDTLDWIQTLTSPNAIVKPRGNAPHVAQI